MQGVDAKIRLQLRALMLQAPKAARDTLAPAEVGGQLKFYLTEILVVARKSTS